MERHIDNNKLLTDIKRDCLRCGSCSESCHALREILPLTPGDISKQVLSNDVDSVIQRYLLRCALCGLCVNYCPQKLSIPEMVTAGRKAMIDAGKVDAGIYRIMWIDYDWNAITLFRDTYQLGFDSLLKKKCDVLFMPGCSLINEAPQLVFAAFNWLAGQGEDKVGLLLDCCGMPLSEMGLTERWEQFQDLFWEKIEKQEAKKIVIACPNCFNQISIRGEKEGVHVISIFELMAEAGVRAPNANDKKITVHDPCPARHNSMGRWVRQILSNYEIREMFHNCENTLCCGAGGVVLMVDPELGNKRASERMQEFKDTQADVCVTYCMACCNTLSKPGNEGNMKHILELVFEEPVDHSQYQTKVQAMWEGEWGSYNDYRLRNSQRISEFDEFNER